MLEAPEEWGLVGLGTAVEHLRPLLASMKWRILRRRRLPFVVIGDAPVGLMAPANHPPHLGVGFASAEVEVGLPLSPDAFLVMTHEPDARDIEVIDLDGHPLLPLSEGQRRAEPKVAVMNIPPEWRYLMPDALDRSGA